MLLLSIAMATEALCTWEADGFSDSVRPIVDGQQPVVVHHPPGVELVWQLDADRQLRVGYRRGGQAVMGRQDVDRTLFYVDSKEPVPLGELGVLLPGAQTRVLAVEPGAVRIRPPEWVLQTLVEGPDSASVGCEALTPLRDPKRATRAERRYLKGFEERHLPLDTQVTLHREPDGAPVGTVLTRQLMRAVWVGKSQGDWTPIRFPPHPPGVVWEGWVKGLEAMPVPDGGGFGGGGSGRGLSQQRKVATARCGEPHLLWAVSETQSLKVGLIDPGTEVVLLEDRGETGEVRLDERWASPAQGWRLEVREIGQCERGQRTLK